MNCKQMHTFFLYDALEVLLLYPLIFLQPDLVQLHEIWSLTRNAFRAEGKHVRFSLSSSVSPFLHIHLQLCSVPCWKHYWMSCVSKARRFFFWWRPNHGTKVLAAHFETIPAGTFLFLLHELMAACSEEQKQWVAVLSPPIRGSWYCTAHTLFAVCGAATFPRSQILPIGSLRGKTVDEGKQTWKTRLQMAFSCSNCSLVPQLYPLSSECLEILLWNSDHFGESVHLTEQYLWEGEEPEGRECYVFVILTRSGSTQL